MAAENILQPEIRERGQSAAEAPPMWAGQDLDTGQTPTILIIDEQEINRRLLRAMLKSEKYRIVEAKRPTEAFALLNAEKVDLVILDLMMPEINGFEFCRQMKANRKTQLIPALILTSVQGADNEIAGIASGADEFLTKPLPPDVVRAHIRAMLRNKLAIDRLEEAESILFALAEAVEQHDKYTSGHCQRLAIYSASLGKALALSGAQMSALHRGAFLHDIGKVSVPDAILYKPGPLTEQEWAIMRTHTTKGEEICRPMKSLAHVLPIIRSHHERWDGSGYPDGLRGEETPLLARILQMADIYDALSTTRPYKPALPHTAALEVLEQESARGWRDPELAALFLHLRRKALQKAPAPVFPAPEPMRQSLENMRRELLK